MADTLAKFQPLFERILVKRADGENKTAGGLFIPETAKEKPYRGKVFAVGEGRYNQDGQRMPMSVRVGDVVIFGKYAGSEIVIDEKEFLIMSEADVMGVVRD